MPAALIEGLFTLLVLLFLVVIPLVVRARGRRERLRAAAGQKLREPQAVRDRPGVHKPQATRILQAQEPQAQQLRARQEPSPEEELLGLPPQVVAMLRRATPMPAMPPPTMPPPPASPVTPPPLQPPFARPVMPAAMTAPAEPAALEPMRPGPPPRSRMPGRLHSLTGLQRAVAWAEILGPPRGLQEAPPR
jgi:hypothetical protein